MWKRSAKRGSRGGSNGNHRDTKSQRSTEEVWGTELRRKGEEGASADNAD
jgi:hypothetical protein